MSRSDSGTTTPLWEYLVYVLVTIPLLFVGAVLWLGSRGFMLCQFLRHRFHRGRKN